MPARALALALILSLVLACAGRPAPQARPEPVKKGWTQKGEASWYGKPYHGRQTANGERYDMHKVSAAHQTLPFDTVIRVKNLDNGRELKVRINDRGPFVRGRIIDLSYGAAKKIDLVGPGTAKVKIVALGQAGKPEPDGRRIYQPVAYDRGNFTIQVGAFKDRYNAEQFVRKLDATYVNAHMMAYNEGGEPYYRVRVGKCSTLAQAAEYENYLVRNGFPDAFTVAE